MKIVKIWLIGCAVIVVLIIFTFGILGPLSVLGE